MWLFIVTIRKHPLLQIPRYVFSGIHLVEVLGLFEALQRLMLLQSLSKHPVAMNHCELLQHVGLME